jgi:hypothetical protein
MRASWIIAIALGACDGQIDGPPGGDPPGGNPDGNNSGSDAEIPGGVGEPANLAGITLFHNQVRAGVQTDNPLPFLTWNADLAATAKAWAEQCVDTEAPTGLIDHNAGRSTGHPYYVGENIYGSGGGASAQEAVELWASEGANYNYATGQCSGVTCGHYTQLVWRATLEVGCALHTCPGLQFGASIVCDYGPGGNSGGGKPY